jgi:hypothetical protein
MSRITGKVKWFTIALSRATASRLLKRARKSSLRLRRAQRDLRLKRLRRCSVSPACLCKATDLLPVTGPVSSQE